MSPLAAACAMVAALAVAHAALHHYPGGAAGKGTARYRRWMVRAAAAFTLPTLLLLGLTGRIDALWQTPAAFAPLREALPTMPAGELAQGAFGGLALGMLVAAIRARRGARPIGRPGPLMPRGRGELGWGAATALVAGATEEPFFRLLLPLLIAEATGSAAAGFVLATLIFAGLHRYQGWRGMIATGVFGAVLSGVYLIAGALWLAVAIHAVVDLNGLVLWPALHPGGAKRPSCR